MFTELDIGTWPRKATYEFFREFEDPFFNFTGNLDVTRFYSFCKKNGLSVSISILYYVLAAANDIREFRIRITADKLIEFDRIHATQTILNDDETFSFAYFEWQPDVFAFERSGRDAVERYKQLKTYDVETERLDLIYCSVIPWVSFTSFKHASRLDRTLSVPRIVFGRMFDEGAVKKMPLSVEANHMLMDGIHVGRLFNRVQSLLNQL
jgi:chloramphenicol O-acetyltransferase type A